jgi:hypothetical protein
MYIVAALFWVTRIFVLAILTINHLRRFGKEINAGNYLKKWITMILMNADRIVGWMR